MSHNITFLHRCYLTNGWWIAWLVFFFSTLNFTFRNASSIQNTPIELSVIHRPICAIILYLILVPWIIKYFGLLTKGLPGFLMLFCCVRVFSSMWSIYPLWTFYRSVAYSIAILLLIFTIYSITNVKQLYKLVNLCWGWIFIMIVSAYLGLLFASKALVPIENSNSFFPYFFTGVFPRINPNALAQSAVIVTTISLHRCLSHNKIKFPYIGLFLLGIITIILTQTRLVYFLFILSTALLFILHKKTRYLSVFLALPLLLLNPRIIDAITNYLRRGQSGSALWSLSNRTYWWATVYKSLTFQDMLYGHGAFAGGRILSPIIGATIGEASRMTVDNTWLELLLNSGFLGVFMFLAVTLYVGIVLLKTAKHEQNEIRFLAIECFVVWVILFIRSFFVSSLMLHSNIPFFVVLGVVLYLRKCKANIPKRKYTH